MNIELRFIQKAIEDKNYLGFEYHKQYCHKVKPLTFKEQNHTLYLVTQQGEFELKEIKKLTVLKERFY